MLVERGLFESRARAQAAIEAGLVIADGKPVQKASESIAADAVLQAQPAHPCVSRGGVKLAGALERYPIEIEDHVCLDVGASTGGFTEVLLANGASLVFAIDVGRDQLHPSLRGHPKIVSMEETDIRNLEGKRLPQRPDVVVIDVSFISLKAVLPVALSLAAAPMHLLALIKPQFEAPRNIPSAASSATPRCIRRCATTSRRSPPRSAAPTSRCFPRRSRAATAISNSSSARAVVDVLSTCTDLILRSPAKPGVSKDGCTQCKRRMVRDGASRLLTMRLCSWRQLNDSADPISASPPRFATTPVLLRPQLRVWCAP